MGSLVVVKLVVMWETPRACHDAMNTSTTKKNAVPILVPGKVQVPYKMILLNFNLRTK